MKDLAINNMTVNLYTRLTENQFKNGTCGEGAVMEANKLQIDGIIRVETWLKNEATCTCKIVYVNDDKTNFEAENFKLELNDSKPVQAIWEDKKEV